MRATTTETPTICNECGADEMDCAVKAGAVRSSLLPGLHPRREEATVSDPRPASDGAHRMTPSRLGHNYTDLRRTTAHSLFFSPHRTFFRAERTGIMNIEQSDIANLPDTTIKRMVIALTDESLPETPVTDFWRRLTIELVRAFRERRAAFDELAFDAMNDDGPGALVEPGTDPVAEGLEELRAAMRRMGGL